MNQPSIQPFRSALSSLLHLLYELTIGAVRDFVWADLRSGTISLRGLPAATQALAALGFGLLFAMVGALLYNDFWRSHFTLLALTGAVPGRGTLLPDALMPATFFLFAVAWAFVLAGALHSHPLVRAGTLALYLAINSLWLYANLQSGPTELWLGWAGLLAVPVLFVVRWRAPAYPVFEFVLILAALTIALGPAQARQVESWRASNIPLVFASLSTNLHFVNGLIVPLLLLAGLSMANFADRAARWTTEIISARLPHLLIVVALAVLLALRLQEVLGELTSRVARSSVPEQVVAYGGAAGIPLAVILIAWLIDRGEPDASAAGADADRVELSAGAGPGAAHDDPEAVVTSTLLNASKILPAGEPLTAAAERAALPLIVAYQAIVLIFTAVLLVLLAARTITLDVQPLRDLFAGVSAAFDWLILQTGIWYLIVYCAALTASFLLARRGQARPALYVGAFGAMGLRNDLTQPGGPLGALSWSGVGNPVDFWWIVLVTVTGTLWLLRGRLSLERAARLFFIVAVSALLRQTDFISNPFSPFLSFTGIGFVAFGIVWGTLTGAAWVNGDSRALPRAGRIFIYVGYSLLSVTLINWALATHNLTEAGNLGGDMALIGLNRFGKPMLYAIYVATLKGR
jgi:hypothetical protein